LEVSLGELAAQLEADPESIEAYSADLLRERQFGYVDVQGSGKWDKAAFRPLLEDYLQTNREAKGVGITLIGHDGEPFSSLYLASTSRPSAGDRYDGSYMLYELADSVWLAGQLPGYQLREQVWFNEAIARKVPVWAGPYYDMRESQSWLLTRSIPLLRGGLVYAILVSDLMVPPPDGTTESFYATASYQSAPPPYGMNPVPRGFYEGHASAASDSVSVARAWEDHLAAWQARSAAKDLARRRPLEVALDRFTAELVADDSLFGRYPSDSIYDFNRHDYTADPVYNRLVSYLEANPDFYGASVTLLANRGEPYFSILVLCGDRAREGWTVLDQLQPFVHIDVEQQAWLARARARKEPVWTGPYRDDRDGYPIWLATRSVPLMRGDTVYAVVTTELKVHAPLGATSPDP
jgi:hypothetical protein